MIPIEEFPYSDRHWDNNPMHERMLLLQIKSGIGAHFAIGYYDVIHDVFRTIIGEGHLNTEQNPYDERQVSGSYADHKRWKSYGYDGNDHHINSRVRKKFYTECAYPGYWCIIPRVFETVIGKRCIKGFMSMDDVLEEAKNRDLLIDDLESVLDEKGGYTVQYLLILKDNQILIAEKSCFCVVGNQFAAFSPSEVNGNIHHISSAVPREQIACVIKLEKLGVNNESINNENRLVNVDELYKDIAAMDLSYMQQGDVLECIKDCMERHLRKRGTTE